MAQDLGPMIVATLTGGPLAGTTKEVPAVEGRPPKTLDAACGSGNARYGLDEWEQSGHSAVYSFLYEV
jgi:hypothetical protein